jgi:hypothetical protein
MKAKSEVGQWGFDDLSFAQDGRIFVGVASRQGKQHTYTIALVGETKTGEWIHTIPASESDFDVESVAIAPDGTKGVLVGQHYPGVGRLRTFDMRKSDLTDTGISGSGWIRYSADGRYMIWQDSNHGASEVNQRLRVIALNGDETIQEVGTFTKVGRIKAIENGGFLIMALRRHKADDLAFPVGIFYQPDTKEVAKIFELESKDGDWSAGTHQMEQMDFDIESMRGIYTTWNLQTRVINLRTGETVLTIDNSANYEFSVSSYGAIRRNGFWFCALVAPVAVGLLLVVVRLRRRIAVLKPPAG